MEAACSLCVSLIRVATCQMMIDDKIYFYDQMSFKAQIAAANGDFATSNDIVKQPGGFQPKPLKSVKKNI